MTTILSTREIAKQITERFPNAVIEARDTTNLHKRDSLLGVKTFLKEAATTRFASSTPAVLISSTLASNP